MSRRARIEHQVRLLIELEEILGAMKNLSLMEAMKLARVVDTQHRVMTSVAAAFAEFTRHYPDALVPVRPDGPVCVVAMGSQRGFCGDFNDAVVRAVRARETASEGRGGRVIAVGRRLWGRLEGQRPVDSKLEGPAVVEEVPTAMTRLIDTLSDTSSTAAPTRVCVVAHRDGAPGVTVKDLWPLPPDGPTAAPFAPRLTLRPGVLARTLMHHYLWSQLHAVFYESLTAENRRRLQHMQGAMQRVGERREALARRIGALRQEEITEEIEMILLSNSPRQPARNIGEGRARR
jgi:F-type H+-transporting ATPase subunit gamma